MTAGGGAQSSDCTGGDVFEETLKHAALYSSFHIHQVSRLFLFTYLNLKKWNSKAVRVPVSLFFLGSLIFTVSNSRNHHSYLNVSFLSDCDY